jgi:hypothetical protein
MFCCTSEVTRLSACCATAPRSVIFAPRILMMATTKGTVASAISVSFGFSFHITPTMSRRENRALRKVSAPCWNRV